MDDNSPLRYALRFKILFYKSLMQQNQGVEVACLSLKALALIEIIAEDKTYSHLVSACQKMLSPPVVDLNWETIEIMLHNIHPIDFYVNLLQAKWTTIATVPFNSV